MIHIIDKNNSLDQEVNSLNAFSDVTYNYFLDNSIFTLSISVQYSSLSEVVTNSFSIPIDIEQYAGQYIEVWLMRDHILFKSQEQFYSRFTQYFLTFNYSQLYGLGHLMQDKFSYRVANIYITKNKQDIYIHPHYKFRQNTGTLENIDYREIPLTLHRRDMITTCCQEFKEYMDKWLIKQNLLNPNIDVSKSTAYLETEVDTLYKILDILLDKVKVDVSEYQPIIDAVKRHNVLNIKSLSKLVNEIDEDKQNIRKQQEIYYDKAYK